MGTREDMNIERFRELVAAYGGEIRQWPIDEREPARRLVEHNAEARALASEASALDAVLDRASRPLASPGLKAAILAGATGSRRRLASAWPFRTMWKPAMALAMAAMLGLTVGTVLPGPFGTSEPTIDGEIGEVALSMVTDTGSQQ
jgi:hypothetical protein